MDIHQGLVAALGRRPQHIPDTEWALRVELAAFYRVVHFFGWSDLIYNHITLRVPGDEVAFLINPYGLLYEEVTAANLVKINEQGEKLAPSDFGINPAGFIIHSAIHAARPDAHCIIHTHTKDGMAVAGKDGGLRFDNFYSAGFYGRVSYHDFQGVTTDNSEKDSLVASLGPTNDVLILRNHGLLVVGPHVPSTFSTMYGLQRACEIQVQTYAHEGQSIPVPLGVLQGNPARRARMLANQSRHGEFPFAAAVRRAIGSFEAVA